MVVVAVQHLASAATVHMAMRMVGVVKVVVVVAMLVTVHVVVRVIVANVRSDIKKSRRGFGSEGGDQWQSPHELDGRVGA